jgi:hypothetical protein
MADEVPPPFYAQAGQIPQRKLTPGEPLFSFQTADKRLYTCELRFRGESYGWEAQFLEGGELRYGRMFLLREEAIRWAETERHALKAGRDDEPSPSLADAFNGRLVADSPACRNSCDEKGSPKKADV